MTVESLLGSLDMYPKCEAEILRALLGIGQNNGHHSASIIEDFYHEVEPSGDEKFGCNNHRVAGLIVLAISASLKNENYRRRIPQKMFSYAAAFFGQISRTFADILDSDSLLQYLSHWGNWCPEAQPECAAQSVILSAAKDQLPTSMLVLDAVKFILVTVKSLWGLVKCGCTSEVSRALRCCKGSLRTLRSDSTESAGAVSFALQYIRVVKVISKIWEHFLAFRKCKTVGQLDVLLAKLEKLLLDLRFRFTGLEEGDEFYVVELVLLSHVLTLSSSHVHCRILHKLSTTISYVDYVRTTKSTISSDFLDQLSGLSANDDKTTLSDPSNLKKLRGLFVLKDFKLTPRIKQVSAEIVVTGYNSVTPLRFLPGLPVGVPLEITPFNVTSDHVLWLRLRLVDELTEFVFLDMEELRDIHEVGQVKLTSPFYRTPNSAAFILKLCVGVECNLENLHPVKGYGSPKHALTYISRELEVYFVRYE